MAWEFYDHKKDPREMDNKYGNEAYTAIIKDLKERLAALRTKVKENDTEYAAIQKSIDEHWND